VNPISTGASSTKRKRRPRKRALQIGNASIRLYKEASSAFKESDFILPTEAARLRGISAMEGTSNILKARYRKPTVAADLSLEQSTIHSKPSVPRADFKHDPGVHQRRHHRGVSLTGLFEGVAARTTSTFFFQRRWSTRLLSISSTVLIEAASRVVELQRPGIRRTSI